MAERSGGDTDQDPNLAQLFFSIVVVGLMVMLDERVLGGLIFASLAIGAIHHYGLSQVIEQGVVVVGLTFFLITIALAVAFFVGLATIYLAEAPVGLDHWP